MLESDAKEDVTKGQDFRRLTTVPRTVLPVEVWKLVSDSSWNDSFSDSCEWFEWFDTAYI